jgi:hypothetical protein
MEAPPKPTLTMRKHQLSCFHRNSRITKRGAWRPKGYRVDPDQGCVSGSKRYPSLVQRVVVLVFLSSRDTLNPSKERCGSQITRPYIHFDVIHSIESVSRAWNLIVCSNGCASFTPWWLDEKAMLRVWSNTFEGVDPSLSFDVMTRKFHQMAMKQKLKPV